MRRSKSNPAKYVKNYRKLSQRRMIDDNENLASTTTTTTTTTTTSHESEVMDTVSTPPCVEPSTGVAAVAAADNDMSALLSSGLMDEYGGDEVAILPPKAKKMRSSAASATSSIELTPAEIKQAALQRKQQARKLQQLADKKAQQARRSEVYASLRSSAVSEQASQLLHATAHWGKQVSRKERLTQLRRKERAGLLLTDYERAILCPDEHMADNVDVTSATASTLIPTTAATTTISGIDSSNQSNAQKISRRQNDACHAEKVVAEKATDVQESGLTSVPAASTAVAKSGRFVATQMLASLATLQKQTTNKATLLTAGAPAASPVVPVDEEKLPSKSNTTASCTTSSTFSTIPRPKIVPYEPSEPIAIQTTQSYDPKPAVDNSLAAAPAAASLVSIQRPAAVTATRMDLPVAAMEFDVLDAVLNHDVTILCASTGSGKSTQVPQFLYEAGDRLVKTMSSSQSPKTTASTALSSSQYLIGVTQPRRVAAVSTAKRICYELGFGPGSSISSNNVVAYQTRHETAGLGSKTRIKFMTDGILLQEIQSDLLLRKYSCIVLDEAHERNLNTDVLLGLLSAALPLRRAASAEDPSLPPLKVIIMSATLRVQDFTGNPRLFASQSISTTVVTVPGRTFPVTIHHSKVTELDDYEEAAFQKTCKIHRKLPEGGILVFLTGRQEIIRMVNRLRRALRPKTDREINILTDHSVAANSDGRNSSEMPRDMDDDEADGDIFQDTGERDDFDDAVSNENVTADNPVLNDDEETPALKAIVRPLYSLLSTEEQAQIFAPVPEGHRLIVVATNIAETSITIPGISYVVDPGRQKCRNYHAETGVASYDIMWISKAAADQRAGRAGRTGPGHCYRLYSSSLYSRHMDEFALPEVLTRPLEDVVLAMKAMKVSNVADFPFPTPPDRSQIDAAAKLLANLGCVDLSKVEQVGGDGQITRLGMAVSKLPLGVRYSKILLVAAEAGVLDYAISIVAALSESNPFATGPQSKLDDSVEDRPDDEDQTRDTENGTDNKKAKPIRWTHKSGDLLAVMLAIGAYTFAGCDQDQMASRRFCEANGLHSVVMERIQKLRAHLARLSKVRLASADGVAARTGGFLKSMRPPNKLHESLLCQSIASGFLDNIAILAPLGSIPGQHPFSLRSAYLSCSSTIKEPLFMDRNSVVYSRDTRQLPKWICFESLVRKTHKDGTPIAVMKNITPIDPSWLGRLGEGSRLLSIGEPISTPLPMYDTNRDAVLCSVKTQYGSNGWEVPPARRVMFDALQSQGAKPSSIFMLDDSFRWFGRFLLQGDVLPELMELKSMLNDDPAILTRKSAAPAAKVTLLVAALTNAGVDSAAALRQHWATLDDKFLFGILKHWTKKEMALDVKNLWVFCVKSNVRNWNSQVR